MNNLKGKHILITGASGGLGKMISYEVAKRGANPILVARNEIRLQEVSEQISEKYGVTCRTYRLDVANLSDVQTVMNQILEDVYQIDVLINNAGFGVFEEVTEASMDTILSMFQVNVLGLIACTKSVLPAMLERNEGHIINIASQAGKLATPKSSGYAASKHAVLGFTNGLRLEIARTNVRVTAVNPGPIQTNFFTIADQTGSYEKSMKNMMLDPVDVARKVVESIGTNKREINLPKWMGIGSTIYQVAPWLVEKLAGNAFYKK
ncbi:SDR family NAD(P)-dependent oxidoreductase [Priestia flexa]|uniref:SDR family NAD(P)-dependent oxidoreductase n=1 Tax=Priestia flexa TaxID=86664 RepID=UPI000E67A401|nr:SDR family oxidoreductase [Priestia flexa]RIV09885.1 SDR family oxidoreductase [Priestia flexa]